MQNSKAIVDTVVKLIENKKLRFNMGNKSRKIADSLSWKNMAEKYLEVYK